MSAQELADLESLYADGVLDEDEYKTKLAELTPKKERTRADELADLEALRNDGILWNTTRMMMVHVLQRANVPTEVKRRCHSRIGEANAKARHLEKLLGDCEKARADPWQFAKPRRSSQRSCATCTSEQTPGYCCERNPNDGDRQHSLRARRQHSCS